MNHIKNEKKGKGRWVAERQVLLEGSSNFRDLGGYRSQDGRTVKWGKLFRSDSMGQLTKQDFLYLDSMAIRAVFDLRANKERMTPIFGQAKTRLNIGNVIIRLA
ncbi:MAG: hypothetical protein COA43_00870 [Robiginitomaculum sp.]|nr:MAG: hypothetical protein COA43_00870 [Robiginitomaculum sp.]